MSTPFSAEKWPPRPHFHEFSFVLAILLFPATSQSQTVNLNMLRQFPSSLYWTAFLNMTYVDPATNETRSERTQTGRFSSAGVIEASGQVFQLLSAVSNQLDSEGNKVYDNTGCDPPFQKPALPNGETWIALVKRGQCTFNQKIANALKLNANGVLVYDTINGGGELESMKTERFSIPSVFTYYWKGVEILHLLKRAGRVHLRLERGSHCRALYSPGDKDSDGVGSKMLFCMPHSPRDQFAGLLPPSHPPRHWDWNLTSLFGTSDRQHARGENPFRSTASSEKRTSVLFVSVSFIVLMLISLAWLVFYYIQRFRYIHAKDRLERRLCRQAKRALAIISTSVLKRSDIEQMQDCLETCAVCIESYKVSDVVRILPCKHQFHKSCIDQWLLEKRTCPMCKMDILKHYGLVDDDEEEDTTGARRNRAGLNREVAEGSNVQQTGNVSVTAETEIRTSMLL